MATIDRSASKKPINHVNRNALFTAPDFGKTGIKLKKEIFANKKPISSNAINTPWGLYCDNIATPSVSPSNKLG